MRAHVPVCGTGALPILPQWPAAMPAVGCGGQVRQTAGLGAVDQREQRELFGGRRAACGGRRAAGVGRRSRRRGARGRFGRLRGSGRGTQRPAPGESRTAPLQNMRRRHHRSFPGRPATRLRAAVQGPGARGHLLDGRQVRPYAAIPADAVRADQPARVRPATRRVRPEGGCRTAHRGHGVPRRAARLGRAGPAHRRRGPAGRRDRPGARGGRRRRKRQPHRGTRRGEARSGRPRPGGRDPGAGDGRRGLAGPRPDRLGPHARKLRMGLPEGGHPHRRRHLRPR